MQQLIRRWLPRWAKGGKGMGRYSPWLHTAVSLRLAWTLSNYRSESAPSASRPHSERVVVARKDISKQASKWGFLFSYDNIGSPRFLRISAVWLASARPSAVRRPPPPPRPQCAPVARTSPSSHTPTRPTHPTMSNRAA
jgi:hypothetical protein